MVTHSCENKDCLGPWGGAQYDRSPLGTQRCSRWDAVLWWPPLSPLSKQGMCPRCTNPAAMGVHPPSPQSCDQTMWVMYVSMFVYVPLCPPSFPPPHRISCNGDAPDV